MKVLGYELDKEQEIIVKDESTALLVIAGAGSGKTLTILGKIKYLVREKHVNQEEIITVTFTNNASKSLREKLIKEDLSKVESYTFHKLSMEILNKNYEIANSDILSFIIHDFLYIKILESKKLMHLLLKYFKKRIVINIKEDYIMFVKNNEKQINNLERLIESFIHKLKCNNYNINSFIDFNKKIKTIKNIFNYKNERILLIIILNIYIEYNKYLEDNNELDFDDLIIKATDFIRNNEINRKIKYIIIDEYQDISYIRLLLIKELIKKTNSKLMVVGDDYQSIYGFSGCDISLFWNFNKYFKNSKYMKIESTYRNSQELLLIANKFITKNKKQIKKNAKSHKTLSNPIRIIYYKDIKLSIKKILNNLTEEVLILGRNNYDINLIMDNDIKSNNGKLIYKNNPSLKIKYMTVHKSKGLECKNVIIINMTNTITGFPSQIKNQKIERLVKNDNDNYLFSEERRLFYVALTRTKNITYIMSPIINKSIFIKEIEQIKRTKF